MLGELCNSHSILQQKMSDSKTYTERDILKMEKVPRLKMINAISGFKSASLVGTCNKNGHENLAIFNSVMHVGSNPPLLGLLVRPLTVPRHTYRNIRETGWFTVNHIRQEFYKRAHKTSGKYRKDISEFMACGFKSEYSTLCPAPYVEEAVIRVGLTLKEETKIEANDTILLIGAIKELTLPAGSIEDDGFINIEAAGTLAISGLDSYHTTGRLSREDFVRLHEDLSQEDS